MTHDVVPTPRPGAAVAIWVKTPGHSPVKTRLAQGIGAAAADAFYRLAVDAVREVVQEAVAAAPGALAPYWAVAERSAAAQGYWRDFPVVPQGNGGLGDRLARVYDRLQPRHGTVLFVGADSPQLPAATLLDALRLLGSPSRGAAGDLSPGMPGECPAFVVGPADDGGYYLFGGRVPLPAPVFTGIAYSESTTLQAFTDALAPHGRIARLPATFDVDTVDELHRLRDLVRDESGAGRPARARLRDWLLTEVP